MNSQAKIFAAIAIFSILLIGTSVALLSGSAGGKAQIEKALGVKMEIQEDRFDWNDQDFGKIPPPQLLSKTFSSSMGYQALKRQIGQVDWPALKGGGSCGA